MRYTRELANVAESPMVQIATAAEAMPGSIKLCYGESDLPTPSFIGDAADAAVKAGHTFYTHTAGCPELREAIARKIHELHGVVYRPAEIMSTVGASMAIYAAIRAFISRGDNAVIVSPAYAIFSNGVIMAGGEARPVSLRKEGGGFRLDLDRLRDAIDRNTRMVIVNSPANPTGWMISIEEQRAVLELAAQHDLVVLADEVYERLVYDDKTEGLSPQPGEGSSPQSREGGPPTVAPSFARVAGHRDRLIVVNSFSKTYNMTGWRLGWAQASEATIKTMYRAVEFMTSNPSAMVQQAGIAALRDGEPHIADLRSHYASRRAQVVAAMAGIPGVSLPAPAGAFYAFVRIDGMTDSVAFTTALLRDTGLALAPGVGFGTDGEGYTRVCFAVTEATLAAALEKFRHFVTSR
jgi:aspartate/methionine/tyrosine aminotransferase